MTEEIPCRNCHSVNTNLSEGKRGRFWWWHLKCLDCNQTEERDNFDEMESDKVYWDKDL